MQRSTRTVCFALGVAAVFGLSGFATASADNVRQKEVSYSDLDLSKEANASTLYTRIERAARSVCKVYTIPRPRAQVLEAACFEKAMDDAVRSVDNPNLTAVYMAQGSKRARLASTR
jgi:UrcA family protein